MVEIVTRKPTKNLPAIGEPARRRVRSAIDLWLAGFASEATRRAYRGEIDAFAAFGAQGDTDTAMAAFLALSDFQAHATVDAWRAAKLEQKLSPASVNRSMSALNSFTASARRHGLTQLRLEARGVKSQAYRDTRGPGLEGVRDMLALAEARPDRHRATRDAAIVMLAFGLGLRRGEIVAIDIADIDLAAGTLAIMGKGRLEKEKLTVPAEVKDALGNWLHYRRATDPAAPVFIGLSRASRGDGRLTGDGLLRIIAGLGERVGIRARPHGLRHAAVTEALNAFGGDFRKVRSFSRHASLETVRKYDDSRADHAGQVSKALAAILKT